MDAEMVKVAALALRGYAVALESGGGLREVVDGLSGVVGNLKRMVEREVWDGALGRLLSALSRAGVDVVGKEVVVDPETGDRVMCVKVRAGEGESWQRALKRLGGVRDKVLTPEEAGLFVYRVEV